MTLGSFSRFVILAVVATAKLHGQSQQQRQGYYIPVTPQPQTGPPCGHYGTKPCPHALEAIPPDATADQLYDMALNFEKQKNVENAVAFLARSAEMGNLHAESAYGFDLLYGKVGAKDVPRGLAFLEKAAAGGNRSAQFKLGSIYDDGDPLPKDPAKAMHYMTLAANQNYWLAEEWLGIHYELGEGVARSRPKAIALLNKAASDGNAQAPLRIAGYLSHPDTPRFSSEAQLANAYQTQIDKEYRKFYPGVGGAGGVKRGPCSNGSSNVNTDGNGYCPSGFDTHGGGGQPVGGSSRRPAKVALCLMRLEPGEVVLLHPSAYVVHDLDARWI